MAVILHSSERISWLVSTTDPLGRVTSYEYDGLGRQIKVTLPDPDGAGSQSNPVFETVYDAVGNVTSEIDALGNVTSYEYDNLYRVVKTIQADPDGAGALVSPEWTTVYDAASQVTSTTDPLGRTTSYQYDGLGRQTQVTQPDPDGVGSQSAPVTTWAYDILGRVTRQIDPLGHVTQFQYDLAGRNTATVQIGEAGLAGQYYLPGGAVTAFPMFDTLVPVHERVDSQVNFTSSSTVDFNGYTDLDDGGRIRGHSELWMSSPLGAVVALAGTRRALWPK